MSSRLHPAPWRGPLRPQHLRRYGWFRLYSDFCIHPKWRAIAIQTGVPVAEVIAVAASILCKANIGRPRGSLAEFSVFECAAALDMDAEHVARVYAALEDRGWIDQDYVVTWDERQPDKEDPTAAERQRRLRARKRLEHTGNALPPPKEVLPPIDMSMLPPREPSSSVGAARMKKYRTQRIALGLVGTFKATVYRPKLIERDGDQCIYCLDLASLEIDHIYPIFQGGTDDLDNLGLACRVCNKSKGLLTPEQAQMAILVPSAREAYQRYTACAAFSERVRKFSPGVRRARGRNTQSDQSVGSVTLLGRDETPRQDEIINQVREPADGPAAAPEPTRLVPRNSGDSGDGPPPDLWLETEGLAVVVERMQCQAPLARVRIQGWRDKLKDDSALVEIIWAAGQPARKRSLFEIIINADIRRRVEEARGPQLPLRPVILRKAGEG